MQNIPAAILKKDIFNLSNFLGIHVHGIIGYYFINSFLVKIKYSNQRLIFYKPGEKVKIKGEPIDIKLILNKPYITAGILAPTVGEINAKLLMDSGASNGLSLESYDGKLFPEPKKKIPANLGMGFSGLISGNIGRVQKVKFTLTDVIASYPDYNDGGAKATETGRNGSVGADLLRHFDLTIDYANNKVYLKPNSNYKLPFEHDMSGLEVYIEEGKSNRFYVERIEPNSPGITAGILVGDEIVSVNFNPVKTMDLENIGNIFKSGDGRTVIVEVFRKSENIYKVLTLKKRI
jgi:membrane-associated protease RseP (regulator of RpoE activity)